MPSDKKFIYHCIDNQVAPKDLKNAFDAYVAEFNKINTADLPLIAALGITDEEHKAFETGDEIAMFNVVYKYAKKRLAAITRVFVFWLTLTIFAVISDAFTAPLNIGVLIYYSCKFLRHYSQWYTQYIYGKYQKEPERKDENE